MLGVGGDGKRGIFLSVECHECVEVQIGQKVAIHHEKRLLESAYHPERAGRACRFSLLDEAKPDLIRQAAAVTEVRSDQLGEVAHCKRDVCDAESDEPLDEHLDHGSIRKWHERLWKVYGEGMQPHAPAPGKYDGSQAGRGMLFCPLAHTL